MTTHPEDAMTRERALEEAEHVANAIKGNASIRCQSDAGKEGYARACDDISEAIRALASAQQEPAPAADVPVDLEIRLRRALTFKEAERVMAALRRCARDSRVTDEMVIAACEAYRDVEGSYPELEHMIVALAAAARAKSGEKGGAR